MGIFIKNNVMKKIKSGDIVTFEYYFGEDLHKGIGYVYKCIDLWVGVSCDDGGVRNTKLSDLLNVKKVDLK